MSTSAPYRFEVYGLLNDIDFHRAKSCAQNLFEHDNRIFLEPVIEGMLEFDWNLFVEAKQKEMRGEMWSFSSSCLTLINSELIGNAEDFLLFAEDSFNYQDYRPLELYATLTEEAYKNHLNKNKHSYVFLDLETDNTPIGRLVIELFTSVVPKTCENFRCLCTGDKHRVLPQKIIKTVKPFTLTDQKIVRSGSSNVSRVASVKSTRSLKGPMDFDETGSLVRFQSPISGLVSDNFRNETSDHSVKGEYGTGSEFGKKVSLDRSEKEIQNGDLTHSKESVESTDSREDQTKGGTENNEDRQTLDSLKENSSSQSIISSSNKESVKITKSGGSVRMAQSGGSVRSEKSGIEDNVGETTSRNNLNDENDGVSVKSRSGNGSIKAQQSSSDKIKDIENQKQNSTDNIANVDGEAENIGDENVDGNITNNAVSREDVTSPKNSSELQKKASSHSRENGVAVSPKTSRQSNLLQNQDSKQSITRDSAKANQSGTSGEHSNLQRQDSGKLVGKQSEDSVKRGATPGQETGMLRERSSSGQISGLVRKDSPKSGGSVIRQNSDVKDVESKKSGFNTGLQSGWSKEDSRQSGFSEQSDSKYESADIGDGSGEEIGYKRLGSRQSGFSFDHPSMEKQHSGSGHSFDEYRSERKQSELGNRKGSVDIGGSDEKESGIESLPIKTLHNSIIHRIVPNGWMQGGDLGSGKGNHSESVFGGVFEDENFILKHTRRGIVGMANRGRHTNGSQFYITMQAAAWMDCDYVAFGKVIEGTQVLKYIESVQTLNERPIDDVIITDCGELKYFF